MVFKHAASHHIPRSWWRPLTLTWSAMNSRSATSCKMDAPSPDCRCCSWNWSTTSTSSPLCPRVSVTHRCDRSYCASVCHCAHRQMPVSTTNTSSPLCLRVSVTHRCGRSHCASVCHCCPQTEAMQLALQTPHLLFALEWMSLTNVIEVMPLCFSVSLHPQTGQLALQALHLLFALEWVSPTDVIEAIVLQCVTAPTDRGQLALQALHLLFALEWVSPTDVIEAIVLQCVTAPTDRGQLALQTPHFLFALEWVSPTDVIEARVLQCVIAVHRQRPVHFVCHRGQPTCRVLPNRPARQRPYFSVPPGGSHLT